MSTFQHSAFFAHELTRRRGSDEEDKFAGALIDAQVDLNPHQVQAALFAFSSPLSGGAILADEVGLGKTIEAGLVISQKWAEHKRHILIITPANLRKQWLQEMEEKFFLPIQILETSSWNAAVKRGESNPFDLPKIVICSYQFAVRQKALLRRTPWDLVVMDEAHRLRNVYKPSNIIGNALRDALQDVPKLLLTATPLQNSLLELFGLVSLIDERVFGDVSSFREQYAHLNNPTTFAQLKARIAPLCHRTLRKQVTQYVNYTQRHVLVQEFTPHRDEQALYEQVSGFLQRETLGSLPNSQRTLITLILRKLLASSSYAIAGALGSIRDRVKGDLKRVPAGWLEDDSIQDDPAQDYLAQDYETFSETADEWQDDDPPLSAKQRALLEEEVLELERLLSDAQSIGQNAKGEALLAGLQRAFADAVRQGAQRKAIIFTESCKTQDYLLALLEKGGYAGKVVLFNGTNTDKGSKAVYQKWLEAHKDTDKVSGSRTADMRSALVDEFRDHAEIMIATEAGAEGINLQFCALVVNYDLPWNPQRIEQRIGRCHRYGQKHDVVVLNFLNKGNEADRRVYELLSEKFKLFEGVFGSSDEVIGAIGSGVDFEKRVAEIYQKCRTPQEISAAFDALQASLSTEISDAMTRTRTALLENFDEEVREKLKLRQEESREQLSRFTRLLMNLTRIELGEQATFDTPHSFLLHSPRADVAAGRYLIPARDERLREQDGPTLPGEHRYRLGHPLAQHLLEGAKSRPLALEPQHLTFDYEARPSGRIGALEGLRGRAGWLSLALYTVTALGQTEEHLLWSATLDTNTASGEVLSLEVAQKLFDLPATATPTFETPPTTLYGFQEDARRQRREAINTRNLRAFEDAAARIDAWSEDLKVGLERDIKELDRLIKEARRAATTAATLQAKLEGQKQVQDLEKKRTVKRRNLFDEQDRIDAERQELIEGLAAKLEEREELKPLFTIRWSLK